MTAALTILAIIGAASLLYASRHARDLINGGPHEDCDDLEWCE